jgi:hypothetical protein
MTDQEALVIKIVEKQSLLLDELYKYSATMPFSDKYYEKMAEIQSLKKQLKELK